LVDVLSDPPVGSQWRRRYPYFPPSRNPQQIPRDKNIDSAPSLADQTSGQFIHFTYLS
jgi:hypothetical protein